MKCCYCGTTASKVVDKREVNSTGEIRRRRECLKCHKRFTTYERVAGIELMVVKRDGTRQVFSAEKLRSGIEKAIAKRPIFNQLDDIVAKIETKFRLKTEKEVPSRMIGQAVLSELKKLDQVAYLRFAAVYRSFQTTGDFTKELETLDKVHSKNAVY